MTLKVNNPEADALTREFAALEGVDLNEAIVIAMREAIMRRTGTEGPLDTAAKLRQKYGVDLTDAMRRPLSKSVYDTMWDET